MPAVARNHGDSLAKVVGRNRHHVRMRLARVCCSAGKKKFQAKAAKFHTCAHRKEDSIAYSNRVGWLYEEHFQMYRGCVFFKRKEHKRCVVVAERILLVFLRLSSLCFSLLTRRYSCVSKCCPSPLRVASNVGSPHEHAVVKQKPRGSQRNIRKHTTRKQPVCKVSAALCVRSFVHRSDLRFTPNAPQQTHTTHYFRAQIRWATATMS